VREREREREREPVGVVGGCQNIEAWRSSGLEYPYTVNVQYSVRTVPYSLRVCVMVVSLP
jgi:hypothetical protein